MFGSTVSLANKTKVRQNEIEARKLRLEVKISERQARRARRRPIAYGPATRLLLKAERRHLKAMRVMAMIEASMAYRKEFRDFAWFKLYMQRESYIRNKERREEASGASFTKLFDVKYHLTTPNGDSFEDLKVYYPLAPIDPQEYWQPTWNPYQPLIVTDGSMVVGDVRVYDPEERFLPISAELFEREYYWESRFLNGPIEAFMRMQCTTGEAASDSADQAVPDKKIVGKKHPRRPTSRSAVKLKAKKQRAANEDAKKLETPKKPLLDPFGLDASPSTSGFVDCYDYAEAAPSGGWEGAEVQASPSKDKKKQKKETYAPYVEYDDPTLPTAEDAVAEKRKQWSERYLRGDTLYGWIDNSLSENLSSNLFYDESTSLRKAGEFIIPDTPSQSIYFDVVPTTQPSNTQNFVTQPSYSSQLYFEPSDIHSSSSSFQTCDNSWLSISQASDDIYFSESDITRSDGDDLESLISSCEESIYFDYLPSTPSSIYIDNNWTGDFENESASLVESSFSTDSTQVSLGEHVPQHGDHDDKSESPPPNTSFDSSTNTCSSEGCIPLSLYGNPSVGFSFVQ